MNKNAQGSRDKQNLSRTGMVQSIHAWPHRSSLAVSPNAQEETEKQCLSRREKEETEIATMSEGERKTERDREIMKREEMREREGEREMSGREEGGGGERKEEKHLKTRTPHKGCGEI